MVPADRYLDRAEETAKLIKDAGGEATAEVDVADSAKVEAMVKQANDAYGRVDILMNNAGISAGNDILTIDEATWDLNLNVVLKGVFSARRPCCRGCWSAIRASSSTSARSMVCTGSAKNLQRGQGRMINLTQNMAVKYGPKGVRVNCICPGSIETPIWSERVKKGTADLREAGEVVSPAPCRPAGRRRQRPSSSPPTKPPGSPARSSRSMAVSPPATSTWAPIWEVSKDSPHPQSLSHDVGEGGREAG